MTMRQIERGDGYHARIARGNIVRVRDSRGDQIVVKRSGSVVWTKPYVEGDRITSRRTYRDTRDHYGRGVTERYLFDVTHVRVQARPRRRRRAW